MTVTEGHRRALLAKAGPVVWGDPALKQLITTYYKDDPEALSILCKDPSPPISGLGQRGGLD